MGPLLLPPPAAPLPNLQRQAPSQTGRPCLAQPEWVLGQGQGRARTHRHHTAPTRGLRRGCSPARQPPLSYLKRRSESSKAWWRPWRQALQHQRSLSVEGKSQLRGRGWRCVRATSWPGTWWPSCTLSPLEGPMQRRPPLPCLLWPSAAQESPLKQVLREGARQASRATAGRRWLRMKAHQLPRQATSSSSSSRDVPLDTSACWTRCFRRAGGQWTLQPWWGRPTLLAKVDVGSMLRGRACRGMAPCGCAVGCRL